MSRRRLSDEERVLWQGITRSVAPLRKLVRSNMEPAPTTAPPAVKRQLKSVAAFAAAPAARPSPPALAPLDRRLKKRVARGAQPIDGRLDLHGLTQAQAHDALVGFLH